MKVFPDAVSSIGGSHAKGIDTDYQDLDIKSKKKMLKIILQLWQTNFQVVYSHTHR